MFGRLVLRSYLLGTRVDEAKNLGPMACIVHEGLAMYSGQEAGAGATSTGATIGGGVASTSSQQPRASSSNNQPFITPLSGTL